MANSHFGSPFDERERSVVKQIGGYEPPTVLPAPRGGEHAWPVPPDGVPVDVRADQPPMSQPSPPPRADLAPAVWRSWFS